MINHDLAKLLFEIGDLLELQEIPFKPRAYHQAAIAIDGLEDNILDIYNSKGLKGLEDIPGIGESIGAKIEEYLNTGKIAYYKQLKKESPIDFEGLHRVEGLGVKKIKRLYNELGIRNLKDLKEAVKKHKVSPIFGFGEKTEQNIEDAIEFLKQSKGRFLLREILDDIEKIEDKLKKIKGVIKVSIAGSVRRRKETIGDVDFLVGVEEDIDRYSVERIMNTFVSMDNVVKIVSKGETRSSIKTKQGLDMDLRLIRISSFGAALQYFTGSKEHNITVRKIAIKKNLKLNEYGLFRNGKKIKGETEEDIYERLGMVWMPPELRENQGEIELAKNNKIPKLLELSNIKGDFHCHSAWNGGDLSLREIIDIGIKRGYEYLGISDHTKSLKIENGLDEEGILRQGKEIDKLNAELKENNINFRLLKGSEVDILKNGFLDIEDRVLKSLDYVSISVHSNFKMSKIAMTDRICKAMNNPYVKILNHPTSRIAGKRDGYEVDMDEIFRLAKKNNIALEINSYRADLSSQDAHRAKDLNIMLTIGSDAHTQKEFKDIRYGVYQSKRGWIEKKNVVNAMTLEKLKKYWNLKID
ncbi:MAG: DNA polymerase/3'-5' exonuclease PolX [Candidatus Pacebacteria bacterium]|nr:DNA polymerase/3'-5' exonuclease PolX [Candidatus Paceibacterota bacterium]